MLDLDPTLIAAWATAAVSLAVQVYLLATWPDGKQGDRTPLPSTVGNLPAAGGKAPRRRPARARDESEDFDWEAVLQSRPGAGQKNPLHGDPWTPVVQKPPVTLRLRMVRAGIYNRRSAGTFHLVRALIAVGMFGGGLLFVPMAHLSWINGLALAALAGLAGYLAPSFWLDQQLRARQTKIRRALPDALDLITVCMQGGLSLPASLARVSRELGTAHPMLAKELSIVEREIQMGRLTGEAIRQFANRFDLEELRSLSSVVGQTEKFGGSITGALRTYADSLRIRRRQRAEEKAQQAAVKLLFPTLFCIFPGIFVVILGPTAIRVYQVLIVANPWNG